MKSAAHFVERLAEVSFRGVFNPYRDACDQHDGPEAPAIRRANLVRYVEATMDAGVHSIWLGRDCGYRGARRTGIALTDEIHLAILHRHLGVTGFTKATTGLPLKERTATEVWKAMQTVKVSVFLWNVFPFHPFEEGDSLTNRCHSGREFAECSDLLVELLEWLRPQAIVALGADAYKAVRRLGFPVVPVRHPSYGGQTAFAAGIRSLYQNGCENESRVR